MTIESKAFLSPNSLCGIVLGGLLGCLTFAIPKLSLISENPVVGTVQRCVFALVLPGIMGAEAASGNVHAWSMWLAAALNMSIYFTIGWLACWGGMKFFRSKA